MPAYERALFDIPEDIAYINCAYLSPLLNTVVAAGREAVERKAHPWTIAHADFFNEVEELRKAFADLIGATADDVAIVNASSYGVATAAANIRLCAGDNIVIPAKEHATTFHKWRVHAASSSAELRVAELGPDSDWANAIIRLIDDETRIISVPNAHWSDGQLFDLVRIAQRARDVGANLVIDGTQSIGALPLDVRILDPDYLVCSAYKWLLCPYTLAFLYVAPRRQGGQPLEDHYFHRAGAAHHEGRLDQIEAYEAGARRFDMGERSNFISLPMALVALRQLHAWGVPRIAQGISEIADAIIADTKRLSYYAAPARLRSSHLFGLRRSGGLPTDLAAQLKNAGVFVSLRGDAIRVSPHLYNTEHDVDRLVGALKAAAS